MPTQLYKHSNTFKYWSVHPRSSLRTVSHDMSWPPTCHATRATQTPPRSKGCHVRVRGPTGAALVLGTGSCAASLSKKRTPDPVQGRDGLYPKHSKTCTSNSLQEWPCHFPGGYTHKAFMSLCSANSRIECKQVNWSFMFCLRSPPSPPTPYIHIGAEQRPTFHTTAPPFGTWSVFPNLVAWARGRWSVGHCWAMGQLATTKKSPPPVSQTAGFGQRNSGSIRVEWGFVQKCGIPWYTPE